MHLQKTDLWDMAPAVVTVSLVCVLMYAAIYQVVRESFNDPQTALVQHIGHLLDTNQSITDVFPQQRVDIDTEVSPWVVVYNNDFSVVQGNGYLHATQVILPNGVLNQAGSGVTNRVTWQPEKGVRQAVIVYTVRRAEGAVYVVSGRNMSDLERRVQLLRALVAYGWMIIVASMFATRVYVRRFS